MRDKYNLNTLPPSLAGLEDYEMDEHISIPGMGGIPGVNDERIDFGDQPISLKEPPPSFNKQTIPVSDSAGATDHGGIPGLDLDVSTVRDKHVSSVRSALRKPSQNEPTVGKPSENFYGTTANDARSILTCVQDVLAKIINKIPGLVSLNEVQPEKIQIYGKEITVTRE